jgi:hypothetical protein
MEMDNNLIAEIYNCIETHNIERLDFLIKSNIPLNRDQQRKIINNNWISIVNKLLQRGFVFDNNDIIYGIKSIEMLDLFLAQGFDINAISHRGHNILINVANMRGNNLCNFLNDLVPRGFNMYHCIHNYDLCPGIGQPDLNEAIAIAIRYDNIDLLQFCDIFDTNMLISTDSHMLFTCVFFNSIKCAEYLLDRGFDKNLRAEDGSLAYESEYYSDTGDRELIKTLIKDYDQSLLIKQPMDNF